MKPSPIQNAACIAFALASLATAVVYCDEVACEIEAAAIALADVQSYMPGGQWTGESVSHSDVCCAIAGAIECAFRRSARTGIIDLAPTPDWPCFIRNLIA